MQMHGCAHAVEGAYNAMLNAAVEELLTAAQVRGLGFRVYGLGCDIHGLWLRVCV